jgi:outer membrane beta-barrel protein
MNRTHSRVSRLFVAAAVLASSFAVSRVAAAGDMDSGDVASYAVQKRLFRLGLELNAGVGLLPLNAFDKGVMVDGSVTWHFNSVVGWEIVQGGYVLANLDTGLKGQLLNNFNVQPTELSTNQFLASTNLLLTPFYGKLAGLNRSVNHVEVFFPIGLAIGRYQNPDAFQQGADLGLGLRWFLGTQTSLRLEARDYMLFESFKNFSLTNELLFSLSLSVAFGGDER